MNDYIEDKDGEPVQMEVCYICKLPVNTPDDAHPWFVDNKVFFIWPLHNRCSKIWAPEERE